MPLICPLSQHTYSLSLHQIPFSTVVCSFSLSPHRLPFSFLDLDARCARESDLEDRHLYVPLPPQSQLLEVACHSVVVRMLVALFSGRQQTTDECHVRFAHCIADRKRASDRNNQSAHCLPLPFWRALAPANSGYSVFFPFLVI